MWLSVPCPVSCDAQIRRADTNQPHRPFLPCLLSPRTGKQPLASPVVCSAWHTSHHSAIYVRCALGKSSCVQCKVPITSFSHSCAVCSRHTSFSQSCAVCSMQVQSCAVHGTHHIIQPFMCGVLKAYIIQPFMCGVLQASPVVCSARYPLLDHYCVHVQYAQGIHCTYISLSSICGILTACIA